MFVYWNSLFTNFESLCLVCPSIQPHFSHTTFNLHGIKVLRPTNGGYITKWSARFFIDNGFQSKGTYDTSVAAACSPVYYEEENLEAIDNLRHESTHHYPCLHTDPLDQSCTADHYKHLPVAVSLEGA